MLPSEKVHMSELFAYHGRGGEWSRQGLAHETICVFSYRVPLVSCSYQALDLCYHDGIREAGSTRG